MMCERDENRRITGFSVKQSASKRPLGFTLIEIMVVVVILGVLGALIVPNIVGRPDEARVTAARSDLQQIGNALDLYRMDNGHYPSTDQGLEALVQKPAGYPEPRRWNPDGYLKRVPVDPWGERYLYINEGRDYDVYSLGADRREGGDDVDKDLKLSDI